MLDIFGKDKEKGKAAVSSPSAAVSEKPAEPEKAPTSFSSPISSVIPKPVVKDAKSPKSSSTTLIARDTELKGDIKFTGSLEIEGRIIGNISAAAGSDSSVRILENGHVEGDVLVPKAIVNGDVKGNVYAACVELAAKARIEGNVHYESLEMTKGAQVNGSLVYSANPLAVKGS